MNPRACYEVYRTTTGWHARLDGLDEPISFISREHAIKVARSVALDRWQLEGQPSCVTVAEQDGRIVHDFGYDESSSGDWIDPSDIALTNAEQPVGETSGYSSATKLSLQCVG
jgi:hypothetical protein